MNSKLIFGLLSIIFGITAAFMGTFFYQNALTGVIYQIGLGSPVAPQYLLNLQLMASLSMFGIILTIVGTGLVFSYKKD